MNRSIGPMYHSKRANLYEFGESNEARTQDSMLDAVKYNRTAPQWLLCPDTRYR